MMQMKTTDDMGKINTLPKFCHLTIISSEKCSTVWMAMQCRIINFGAIFYVLSTSIILKS